MAKPKRPTGYQPTPVNSKTIKFSGTRFDKSYIAFHKRFSGAIVMSRADFDAQGFPAGNLHSLDLVNDVFLGSAILIDFNFILMALHTLQPFPLSAMKNSQIRVVFSNDLDAATADNTKPPFTSQQPRPFAFLRGDSEAFVGKSTDEEDFAIVKIDWNQRGGVPDFQLVGKSAVLAPPTFNRTSLTGKSVASFLQYSGTKQIASSGLPLFSGHVAQGKVTDINKSLGTSFGTTAANRVVAALGARFGSSGSGFYNEDGELVGVLGGGTNGTFFLPIDVIYASTNVAFKRQAGQVLKDIFNFRKSKGEFVGEGKGKPVP
ncbi:MAG: hypothetical protein ACOY0T_41045 [Myxococcota bacterium]